MSIEEELCAYEMGTYLRAFKYFKWTTRSFIFPGMGESDIIALTSKAMKGDREECIDFGASDYLAKPIKDEQLMLLLRVWLYK